MVVLNDPFKGWLIFVGWMGILEDVLRYSEIAACVLLVVLFSPTWMFRSFKLVYNLPAE